MSLLSSLGRFYVVGWGFVYVEIFVFDMGFLENSNPLFLEAFSRSEMKFEI